MTMSQTKIVTKAIKLECLHNCELISGVFMTVCLQFISVAVDLMKVIYNKILNTKWSAKKLIHHYQCA